MKGAKGHKLPLCNKLYSWINYSHQTAHYILVKVKVPLSCPTLCHSMDYTVHGIPTCNARNLSLIPGWEDPLEKGKATHFSILAWRIP